MRIAAITTSQVPATTANSIQAMKACEGLVQNGHEVHLFVPGEKTEAWGKLSDFYGIQDPFEISWLPENRFWRRYDYAWKAFRQGLQLQSDLLYTWAVQVGVLGLLWKIPVVLEIHDRPTGRLGPLWFRRLCRVPGKKRVACITQALLNRYGNGIERLQSEEKVIAPNGVELERYTGLPDAVAARLSLALPERLTCVYTGHFYPGRGMEVLFFLAQVFPEVSFLWIGGRPQDVESWRDRLSAKGVQNVSLPGFIENKHLPLYQAAADVLLMPYERTIAGSSGGNSAEICSPMKMFEYLATGRAILTSDLPVLHEILNEQNAVFCPPEEPSAWQEALAGLLADPRRRERLGRQARLDAENYTWRERARRILTDFG